MSKRLKRSTRRENPIRSCRVEKLEDRRLLAGDAVFTDSHSDASIESSPGVLVSAAAQSPVAITGWADSPGGDAQPLNGYTSSPTPTLFGTARPDSVISLTGIAYASPSDPIITGPDGRWQATIGPLPTQKRDFIILAVARNFDENGLLTAYARSERVTLTLDRLAPKFEIEDQPTFPNASVSQPIAIQFSDNKDVEVVRGFGKGDLLLTRDDDAVNLLRATRDTDGEIIEQPLVSRVPGSAGLYSLSDIELATSKTGTYELSFDASESAVTDLAGNEIARDASIQFTVDNSPPVFESIDFFNPAAAAANVPAELFQQGDRPIIRVTLTDQQFATQNNLVRVLLYQTVGDTGQLYTSPEIIRYLGFAATNDPTLVTQNTTQTQQLVLPDDLPLGVYRYAIRLQDTKIVWEDATDEDTDGRGFHRGPVQTFTFAVVPPYQSLQRNAVEGDVSGDGSVSAGDALIIINHLSTQGLGESESIKTNPNAREFRMDVNGDGVVSAMDALEVINRLAIVDRPTPDIINATGMTHDSMTNDSDDQWELSVDQWLTALEKVDALF